MQMRKAAPVRTRRKPRAATEDVVGNRAVERIPAKWRKHYRHLLELRDYLARRQAALARDAQEEQPKFSTHMGDAGTDTYDRDFSLGMLSSEQDAMYEIEQALDRIRSGAYGVCELTGKRIESARLEAIPWTRFTTAAEKQLEKEGAIKRARLGPRESIARSESGAGRDEEEEE